MPLDRTNRPKQTIVVASQGEGGENMLKYLFCFLHNAHKSNEIYLRSTLLCCILDVWTLGGRMRHIYTVTVYRHLLIDTYAYLLSWKLFSSPCCSDGSDTFPRILCSLFSTERNPQLYSRFAFAIAALSTEIVRCANSASVPACWENHM